MAGEGREIWRPSAGPEMKGGIYKWRSLQKLRRASSWQPGRKWGSQSRNAKKMDFLSNLNRQIPPNVLTKSPRGPCLDLGYGKPRGNRASSDISFT